MQETFIAKNKKIYKIKNEKVIKLSLSKIIKFDECWEDNFNNINKYLTNFLCH